MVVPPLALRAAGTPVTIAVVSFNYGHYLREAVDSALAQEGADIRVVVVDDGSTDDTADVARGYGDAILYLPKTNGGLSDARNTAAAACTTPWILYLDADNRLPPGHVQAMLDALRRQPDASYAYCQLQHFGDRDDRTSFPDFDVERLKRGNYIDAGALLPADLVRAHPYDTGLRRGLEDWDFFLGLAEAGHRGTLADTATEFRVHGSSMGSGVQRRGWRRRLTYARIYRRHWRLLGPSSAAGMVRRMVRHRLRRR